MCGPSGAEKQIGGSEQKLSQIMQSNYIQNFGQQQAVLQSLNNTFTPIVEAGIGQQGFGPQELAALNTQATEGVAANYQKAQQALNTSLATRGGGNEILPTGASAALKETLASQAAQAQSAANLGITRENYAQGRQNWREATAGLETLGQQYNPVATGGLATGANQAAFGEASQIQQQQNQLGADIAGGITSLGMGALTFGAGAAGGGGFAGGLKALTGVGGGGNSSAGNV